MPMATSMYQHFADTCTCTYKRNLSVPCEVFYMEVIQCNKNCIHVYYTFISCSVNSKCWTPLWLSQRNMMNYTCIVQHVEHVKDSKGLKATSVLPQICFS